MSESPATTSQASTNQSTPIHLWIVGIVALLWSAMGAMDFVMTMTKNEAYMGQFSAEELEFFYSIPTWVLGTWFVGVWGGVIASILMLMRKKISCQIYLASFLGALISTFHNYVLSNGLEVMGTAGAIAFTAAIILVALALVLYSRAMVQRGVLR